jgi:eukaryotic-like serine/threonine-protein kinase
MSTTSLSLRSAPPADDPLLTALVEELARRWRCGDPVRAEEMLDRHPELWHAPARAVRLVYEEICLRRECGLPVAADDCFSRFPEWRAQLALLLECHALLEDDAGGPRWPTAGETIAGYELQSCLGDGAGGCVFLARQLALADRPVVVKATRLRGNEHLHLARLQHTHIVPLYAVHDEPARNLRLLCMPYFGGAGLAQVLRTLGGRPLAQRTGACILAAAQVPGVQSAGAGPSAGRQLDYVASVCFIGACLAEALHFAHECGVVHLDLKPANVLIAADGQPLLLDFHLARPPLDAGATAFGGLGGTPGYMPPEQQQAMAAIAQGRPIPLPVDRRADVFALGVILREALGGADTAAPLRHCNPLVSVGLADVVDRCLAPDARHRYPDAAALADDLHRHLSDLPLRGVRNRSWPERLMKWRRRRPAALRTGLLALTLLALLGTAVTAFAAHLSRERQDVRRALDEGRALWHTHGDYAAAQKLLQDGLAAAQRLPWHTGLADALRAEIRLAEEAQAAHDRQRLVRTLHTLAEHVRLLYGLDALPADRLRPLRDSCKAVWDQRRRLRAWFDQAPAADIAEDLTDLVLFAIDVQQRTGPAAREALADLDDVESLFGPSAVVDWQRRRLSQAFNLPPRSAVRAPATAWEFFTLGRLALQAGDLTQAADYLGEALTRQPHGLWPNYYHGLCAARLGRPVEAVAAFSVCIGAAPDAAAIHYNRGLAYAKLAEPALAIRDYDHALSLDPTLSIAVLNRGILHYQAGRLTATEADLRRALTLGADPIATHFDLALVLRAQHRPAEARDSLDRVLTLQPNHAAARELISRLAP